MSTDRGSRWHAGLIYCMEYLEKNLDWLKEKLDGLKGVCTSTKHVCTQLWNYLTVLGPGKYLLFDLPGQVPPPSSVHSVNRMAAVRRLNCTRTTNVFGTSGSSSRNGTTGCTSLYDTQTACEFFARCAQLTCVHLVDSHHCADPSKFVAVSLQRPPDHHNRAFLPPGAPGNTLNNDETGNASCQRAFQD